MRIIKLIIRIFIFSPLSFLWSSIYAIRRFLYKIELISSDEFDIPIISIGNLAFGGTGKTPFTIYLTNLLEEQSKRVRLKCKSLR